MMTRKDYVKTAEILKGFSDEIHPNVFEDLVEEFAQYFMSDNDRFDKARFEKACGVDELGLIPA
jgi:hypothetical protein